MSALEVSISILKAEIAATKEELHDFSLDRDSQIKLLELTLTALQENLSSINDQLLSMKLSNEELLREYRNNEKFGK